MKKRSAPTKVSQTPISPKAPGQVRGRGKEQYGLRPGTGPTPKTDRPGQNAFPLGQGKK